MTRHRRLALGCLAALAVAALAAGHLAFWYAPRLRLASLSPAARAVLADPGYDAAAWVAFPHQTLPALHREVFAGDAAALAAVLRLAGAQATTVPRFGPLGLPPAREMALGWRRDRERFHAATAVYPAAGLFARLAGVLAGNPWLGGGEVRVDGRPGRVEWRDGRWTVTAGEGPATPGDGADADGEALAVLVLRAAAGEALPPGRYRLMRTGGAVELTSGSPPSDVAGHGLDHLGVVLLRWDGAGSRALAVLAGEGALELPRLAVLHRPGGPSFDLPGEVILELAGRDPRRARAAGFEVVALDGAGLAGGVALAPYLRPLADARRVLWLDVAGAHAEVGRVAAVLREVPLLPRRTVAPWVDGEAALAALDAAGWRSLSLVVDAAGGAGLRLAR